MKFLLNACAAAVTAGALLGTVSIAFAQNSPGVPGGILQDEFRLQEHPQLCVPSCPLWFKLLEDS
jgi:hypothetical protein